MNNYLAQIKKIIEVSHEDVDGILIADKKGYVEYYKPYNLRNCARMTGEEQNQVGKHVLDLYPEIDEQNSTVMETLRTGKIIVGKKQTFTWHREYKLTLMSITYPILENGEVQGAIDVAKFLSITGGKASAAEKIRYVAEDIITQDPKMEEMKAHILRVADSESPVLIYGETGTGKELVAEALHMSGPRKKKPFVAQNCAAVPDTLMESIFFGTEKGGFTGAETRKGLFELAAGGTLFLDEMNSMNLSMQAKLLKSIEEKRIRRIGGSQDISFDVRIICASNEDPEELVASKRLRADLYYRVGVIKIEVPPLRKRIGDVKLLTSHFIQMYNDKMNRNIRGLSLMTEQLLERWQWPGNVRELKNTIESAFNIEQSDWISIGSVQDLLKKVENSSSETQQSAQESMGQALLPEKRAFSSIDISEGLPSFDVIIPGECLEHILDNGSLDLKQIMADCERHLLKVTLEHEGQLKRAAQKLCISPQKLQYRMETLGLRSREKR